MRVVCEKAHNKVMLRRRKRFNGLETILRLRPKMTAKEVAEEEDN
jgi:hypothetical protein